MHAAPGTEIPLAAITGSRADWQALKARGNASLVRQREVDEPRAGQRGLPAESVPQPLRLRAERVRRGRPDGPQRHRPELPSGRLPLLDRKRGRRHLADEQSFAAEPKWEYLSGDFQHNNTAALELDPNDPTSNVIYAGTGEPNTCRSGCIAGVGLYKSKDGGNHWSGPIGAQYFTGRGIGSIQVKPGDPSTIFVGLRGPGLAWHQQHLLHGCRPRREHPRRSALRALALDRRWATFELVSQGNTTNCTDRDTDGGVQRPDAVLAAWRAPRALRPRRSEHGLCDVRRQGDLALELERRPGQLGADLRAARPATSPATGADVERAEFDVVALPDGGTRMYVGVGGGAARPPSSSGATASVPAPRRSRS